MQLLLLLLAVVLLLLLLLPAAPPRPSAAGAMWTGRVVHWVAAAELNVSVARLLFSGGGACNELAEAAGLCGCWCSLALAGHIPFQLRLIYAVKTKINAGSNY